jgi:hypothetical protein
LQWLFPSVLQWLFPRILQWRSTALQRFFPRILQCLFTCFAVTFNCFVVTLTCFAVTFSCYAVTLTCFAVSFSCYAVTLSCLQWRPAALQWLFFAPVFFSRKRHPRRRLIFGRLQHRAPPVCRLCSLTRTPRIGRDLNCSPVVVVINGSGSKVTFSGPVFYFYSLFSKRLLHCKLSTYKTSTDKMSTDKMSTDKMSTDKTSTDKMSNKNETINIVWPHPFTLMAPPDSPPQELCKW